MAQYRKDEIDESIVRAALGVFARRGYEGATMAEIARSAGISTGNIYRYYETKEQLFAAAVPDEFVTRFTTLLRRRVAAARAADAHGGEAANKAFDLAKGELLSFCIENRWRVVVLLGRAEGTRLAGFSEQMTQSMIEESTAHFRAKNPGLRLRRTSRLVLEQVYRNQVGFMVRALEHLDDGAEIRDAVEAYSRYHFGGLKGFFEG